MITAPARQSGRVRDALPIAEVLRRAISTRGWEERVGQEVAVKLWPRIIGAELGRHTIALGVRDGLLNVAVRSGAWAAQLGFFRTELLRRLRAEGAQGIRDIAFRVGNLVDLPSQASGMLPGEIPHIAAALPAERLVAAALAEQSKAGELTDGFIRLYMAAASRRRRLDSGSASG